MKQKLLTTMMLALMLVFGGQVWGQTSPINESFSNIGPYVGYQTETWTGDDGGTWTATDARTDQSITGKAICIRNGVLTSPTVSGGIGSLTVTTQRKYSGGSGNMDLRVNGSSVGSIPYDGTVQTTTINNINISGDVVIVIDATNSSSDRPAFDDLSWTAYAGGGTPTAATPTFTPAAGTYYAAQNVTISTTTPGATLYYTTDGSDPDNTDTEYTTPVAVSSTTTLKAIAYATGFDPSTIGSAVYTFPTIVEVPDIATLRASAADEVTIYKLTGEAILTFKQTFRNQKFIQDGTAGILIDDYNGLITTPYNVGDGITNIIGTLLLYTNNGMLEFIPAADPGAASSTGNAIVPIVVSAADFQANFETYESRVVEIQGLTFTDAGGTFTNGQKYPMTTFSSMDVGFRATFYGVDYIGTTIPSGSQNVKGIANETADGYFITARDSNDFSLTPIPLGTSGIVIAIFLIAAVLFYRRGKLF
jgi:hypothetical protein